MYRSSKVSDTSQVSLKLSLYRRSCLCGFVSIIVAEIFSTSFRIPVTNSGQGSRLKCKCNIILCQRHIFHYRGVRSVGVTQHYLSALLWVFIVSSTELERALRDSTPPRKPTLWSNSPSLVHGGVPAGSPSWNYRHAPSLSFRVGSQIHTSWEKKLIPYSVLCCFRGNSFVNLFIVASLCFTERIATYII